MISNINLFIIIIQILILLSLLYRESRKNQINFLLIFVVVSYIILVQFQSLWLHYEFDGDIHSNITIVGNKFSYDSYFKTNILFFFAVVVFSLTVILTDKLRLYKNCFHLCNNYIIPFFAYFFVICWFLLFSVLLINKIGGIETAVNNPGQMIEGQTVFILMLSLAKWPLLLKLNFKSKLNIFDFTLFFSYFTLVLFNSRFLASFAIVQLVLVYHYRVQPIKIKNLVFVAIPFFFIFIVFGVYRDFSYRFETVGFLEASTQYDIVKDDFSITDWFFTGNVEAFTGTAGIIHFSDNNINFKIDYGLSEFSNLLNFIPNKLRNSPNSLIKELNTFFTSAYPYKGGSVVPSGLETSFGHLSYFGFFLYNILIAFLPVFFHKGIIAKKSKLLLLILSVHLLNSVRASFFGAFIFFGTAEIITFFIFKSMLKKKSVSN